ncbi:hypothetical protein BKM09_011850 [Pseudomonas amygdali pv. morsprunorum]|nr:hypothetical protein [Pseudomonas amygdali]POY79463.1 hypothetical protein BKM09_011850 [Pseudomonas amygdali pv. morsprunorum]
MANINEGLDAFCKVHAKHGLAGSINNAPSGGLLWPRNLPTSNEIEALYLRQPKNIKFETGFTPKKGFDIEHLEKGQVGYLWNSTPSGLVVNDDWPNAHVVFIDSAGGDPIIAVTDQENTPIYAAFDAFRPFRIADSMGDIFLALSKLIDIVYGEFDIFEISDDDGLNDAFVAKIASDLKPILGQENFERFIEYFYG